MSNQLPQPIQKVFSGFGAVFYTASIHDCGGNRTFVCVMKGSRMVIVDQNHIEKNISQITIEDIIAAIPQCFQDDENRETDFPAKTRNAFEWIVDQIE